MKNKFKPEKGQTDYTKARWAPVINCVLKFRDRFLVVQRSENLHFFPGFWNGISGFLDDKKSLEEKAKAEIKEELGIPLNMLKRVRLCGIFHQESPEYGKTWIVHAVSVQVKTDKVKLDWEARNYKWVTMSETSKLKLLPGFRKVLDLVSK
ncbi:MAG: NUDIX domain-containing protein [bacterium]|nr:NUDIX domain-containing protein [bacterium]